MIVLLLFSHAARLHGQEGATSAANSVSSIEVIQRNGETGETIPVPGFSPELLKEMLDRAQLQAHPPLYRIEDLKLLGQVSQGLVDLRVQLQIQILRDGEAIAVPLGFEDLQLRDHVHRTAVSGGSGYPNVARLPVKEWIFFGKGRHELELTFVGVVRSALNGTQRLTLAAPKSVVSHLQIGFSERVTGVTSTPEKPFELSVDEAAATSALQMWGLTESIEISWLTRPSESEQTVNLQASAAADMRLDLTTVPASLAVRQPLNISGGALSELRVRLPAGFRQVSIDGVDGNGNSVVKSVSVTTDETNEALITFNSAVTGALILNYDLGLKDTAYPQEITVQVPDVESVSNETADLEIYVPRGLEFDRPREHAVRSKRVETSRDLRTAALAYRLLSSDSRIHLKVSESEVFFAVSPQISFTTEQDQILKRDSVLVSARFSVNVIRGSLNELTVRWPGYLSEGWQILAGDTRLIAGQTSTPISGFASPTNPDEFTMVFPERQSGQFEIELQGFRDLESFQAAEGLTYLPEIDTPTAHSAIVSLVESDEYSMYLVPLDEQPSFPVLPSNRWPESLKAVKQPLTAWLVDAPDRPMRIRITPQRPEVRTRMLVAVSVVNESFHVREVLSFDVRHRELSEIQLSDIGASPTVRLEDASEALERTTSDGEALVYSLPSPMRGSFRLIVDYNWSGRISLQTEEKAPVAVPLVLPLGFTEDISEIVVATNSPEKIVLDGSSGGTPVYSEEYSASWVLNDVPETLPIQLRQPLSAEEITAPQFVVATTVVNPQTVMTRVTAVYDKLPGSVLCRLSREAVALRASMNGRAASFDQVDDDDPSSVLFQLTPAPDIVLDSPAEITIVTQQIRDDSEWRQSILLPELLGAEDCNVVWIVPQIAGYSIFPVSNGEFKLSLSDSGGANQQHSGEALALAPVISPFSPSVRERILEIVDDSVSGTDACEVVLGTMMGTRQKLYTLSRSLLLLIVSACSLVIYFLVQRLGLANLCAIFVVLGAAAVGITGFIPTAVTTSLIRYLPLFALAAIAAVFQRYLSGSQSPFLMTPSSDEGSTIFVVEPVQQALKTAGNGTSALSASRPSGLSPT